jgi:hypothetical protein
LSIVTPILTSVQTPEDLINAALVRIGYPITVDQMMEGSRASRAAVRIYGQTRDEMLRKQDYGFAVRQANLTKLKVAPAGGYNPFTPFNPAIHPPLPWGYEYAYPIDCLQLLSLRRPPIVFPVLSPRAVVWSIRNDNSTNPAQKVILTNLDQAVITYTARVTDLTVWDAATIEALISAVATRLAPALGKMEFEKSQEIDHARDESSAVHLEG